MDKSIERRNLLKYLTLASTAIAVPKLSFAAAKGEILIIGGGFGGAATAKYLSNYAPQLKVTLIEPNEKFITCPFSNTVLADLNKIDFITHD
jgi:sulfide dehydrogenase [flavocytochrome c] flavoprotein chain